MLIGYSRISTQGQDHALQIDALNRAGCERVFVETASGRKGERPELAKAMEYARSGDMMVIYSMSRLARSLRQLIATVDELQRRGIGLRSLSESIDTSTPSGVLALHFFAALQQFEVDQLRERTRAGLRAAAARGRKGGRPRSLDDKKLKVARALMADPNLSTAEIARQLEVAPSTLYRHFPGGRGVIAPGHVGAPLVVVTSPAPAQSARPLRV
jgi:DNA invertase Pin-like site-specific DNA recombinase